MIYSVMTKQVLYSVDDIEAGSKEEAIQTAFEHADSGLIIPEEHFEYRIKIKGEDEEKVF